MQHATGTDASCERAVQQIAFEYRTHPFLRKSADADDPLRREHAERYREMAIARRVELR